MMIHIPFNGICQDTTKTTNQGKLRSTNRSHSQPGKYSLHGTIKAKGTGEVIIGATVSVTGFSIGTVSNEYGFYSLTLQQDDYTLISLP